MWLFKKKYTNLARAKKRPKRVRNLRLSFEDMNQVNSSIGTFSSLESLEVISDVWQPVLCDFSGHLAKLKSLTTVNVIFSEFPEWILKLKELECLHLRGCEFKSIPNEIASLSKLKVLRLENIDITSLPESTAEMHNLEELSLIDCWHLNFQPGFLPEKLCKLSIPMSLIATHHQALLKQRPSLKIETY